MSSEDTADGRDEAKLALIELALAKGITWRQLARSLNLPDKTAAMRYRRDLERTIDARKVKNPADAAGLAEGHR